MVRSFRYRLSPTRAQTRVLDCWLRLTREIYNAALQERKEAWAKQRVRVTTFDQMRALPSVRAVRPEFAAVPISVLRGALRRLDRAFAGFFQRCKTGAKKPGYPRFRGRGRFESILIDDLGGKTPIVAGGKRVAVALLGKIKFKQHRPVEGKPKALRLTLRAGKWYVTFACVDVPMKPLPPTGNEVGIDLGLTHFVATSDGDTVPALDEREGRRAVGRAARRVSRRKRGGERRREAVRLLARAHERVANARRERSILLARALVARYDRVYVEKLNIVGMSRGMLSGPIHRVAWGNFLHWLRVKVEETGREVVEVNPRGTSQTCPECGTIKPKALSERVHRCDCGLVCDRDVAAARVILGVGQTLRRGAPVVVGPRRPAKPKSARRPDHTVAAAGDF